MTASAEPHVRSCCSSRTAVGGDSLRVTVHDGPMRLFRGPDGLVCPECGVAHEGLVTVFGPEAPDAWVEAPLAARVQGELGRDQGYLPWEQRLFTFIRGHVVLPISGRPGETFAWSVWSTLAPDDMETIEEHWDDPRRVDLPAMAGRLANALPYDESTLGLSLRVQHREPGQVPHFVFAPEVEHPLAEEQRHGIPWHRVAKLNQQLA